MRVKFTRVPKMDVFVEAGVPHYCYGTFVAIADHANNKNGLCWPSQQRLASLLNLSVRQIRRHIKLLIQAGLLMVVSRYRHKGRFSTNLYRVLFIQPEDTDDRSKARRVYRRTKPGNNPPNPPEFNTEYHAWKQQKRREEEKRRWEGYEFLLK